MSNATCIKHFSKEKYNFSCFFVNEKILKII